MTPNLNICIFGSVSNYISYFMCPKMKIQVVKIQKIFIFTIIYRCLDDLIPWVNTLRLNRWRRATSTLVCGARQPVNKRKKKKRKLIGYFSGCFGWRTTMLVCDWLLTQRTPAYQTWRSDACCVEFLYCSWRTGEYKYIVRVIIARHLLTYWLQNNFNK